MYQQPFGSIFGETPLKKDAEVPAVEPVEVPATEESRNQILEAKKATQHEEIRKPKIPFSREEPQFRAASTVVSKDPAVLLSQSELSVERSQIKYATLVRELNDLKAKISAGKVYLSTLRAFSEMPESKQKEIDNFIVKNEKKLKALANNQKATEASKTVKEASAALDAEIRHWEELDSRKGKVELTSFRPRGAVKVSEELPTVKLLPKIGGKAASVVRLDKSGIAKFSGYGDEPKIDQVISAKPKQEEFYVKFMHKLPSQSFFTKLREADFKGGRTAKKTEKNVLLAQQYEWKSAELEQEIGTQKAAFAELQKQIDQQSLQHTNQKALVGLSIAVLSRPESFRSGMLLDNLRSVVSKASGLGDATPPEVIQQEVTQREAVLTDLQAKVINPTPQTSKRNPLVLGLIGLVVLYFIFGGK